MVQLDGASEMKIHKGKFFLSDLATASYKQRLFYVVANYMRPNWSALAPNINPLDWCLRDAFKVVYLAVLFSIIYPIVMIPCAFCEAYRMKSRYTESRWIGVYQNKTYWME